MPHDLLIFGASARAAAWSALRCGLRPRCADYFLDRDLEKVCHAERIDPRHATRDFAALSESLPPSPWFYTGGFENRPELVERIARRHQLWGALAPTLGAVRDPVRVVDVLRRAQIACPAVQLDPRGLPRDGSWLVKPLASGGGRGIKPLFDASDRALPAHYYQERIRGPSFSALFIGSKLRTHLIGVTRQLIGVAGHPFGYRGSIGPWPLRPSLLARLQALGDVLTSSFGLAGWFGVDYVLSDGIPWQVEINPRYTASIEVHELSLGRSLLEQHRSACEGELAPQGRRAGCNSRGPAVIGKLILHAPRRLVVPEIPHDEHGPVAPFAVRSVADVPWPGSRIDPGKPVMTVLAAGASRAECWARLTRLERRWQRSLKVATANG